MNSKIIYDTDMIKIMSLFESITRTKLKDFFKDHKETLNFIVVKGEIGKAVGKKASNVKKLEKLLNRKIKIVEFDSKLKRFIKNIIFPLKTKNISEYEGIITIDSEDSKTRGILIGRNAQNLRNLEQITKKYFPELKEIKVV